ncbi:hypothetical protein TRVL_10179 [Trypanosoma vivax]|nr:hypothetical protein TRVL_10179 [Trypanosoma vivax]
MRVDDHVISPACFEVFESNGLVPSSSVATAGHFLSGGCFTCRRGSLCFVHMPSTMRCLSEAFSFLPFFLLLLLMCSNAPAVSARKWLVPALLPVYCQYLRLEFSLRQVAGDTAPWKEKLCVPS